MTTAATLFRLLQGHEIAVVGILQALAAVIIALVKLIKALVDGAGKLFRLWREVRQKKGKSRVVSRPRRVYARRIRPALGSGGKADKIKGSATRR
jgi:hypothetical protein